MLKCTIKLQASKSQGMYKILWLIYLLTLSLSSAAQDFKFGETTQKDHEVNRNTIDSNANAVVLNEFGKAFFFRNENKGIIELIFEYHVKIKIFNKEGFNQANIVLPSYKDDSYHDREELITGIEGFTYNMVNGNLKQTPLDKKGIFKENRNKYTQLTKFTMPDIQEGSIIEYKYRLESPHLFNFKTWEFQTDIPKISSTYLVFIPGNYNYNVTLRGYQKLTDTKMEVSKGCLRISGVEIDCSKITYVMDNIPAFVEEDYMTASSNFKSAIYFELSDMQQVDGIRKSFTKTWKDVDFDLVNEKELGSQMKRKDLFKDIIPTITKNAATDVDKAKEIYNYIKKHIKWNNYYGKYSESTIKNALELRSGNVADINLSLISALSAANLDAEAVILSTRDNGNVNKLYPVITNFNYLVAKVNIGDQSYLLDASEPLLPFGLLPLRCINGQGRVIHLKKPSYWIDLKANIKSTTNYLLTGALAPDGKIKGTISTTTIGYAAFNKRKDIKMQSSMEEYVEKLDERMPNLTILDHEILNVDSVEKPLIEKYTVEFAAHDALTKEQLYFSPFMINPITKNPFKLNERNYPVDLGAAADERIVINVSLPSTYEMVEQPKNMAMALPENGGRYLLQTRLENNSIMVNQVLQLNKSIYSPDDYHALKEFYSKIIQNQKTEVLLKKTK